jgi:hypothetical protein
MNEEEIKAKEKDELTVDHNKIDEMLKTVKIEMDAVKNERVMNAIRKTLSKSTINENTK